MKKPVLSILSALTGAAIGAGAMGKASKDRLNIVRSYRDKHLALFLMMNEWVKVKQQGKNLADFFVKNGYKKIAIYGMSYAGETLVDELKGSEVTVAYGIDKNADSLYADVEIVSMEDDLEEVDAIIVTTVMHFDEITELLQKKVKCPVLSLENIIDELFLNCLE